MRNCALPTSAQFRIGARKHGADGSWGDVKARGDIPLLRVLTVAHDDDGALALRQARD
jgi:hypothetical protein